MNELEKLETMLRIRLFEERVAELRASNDIVGSVHLCNGQEAIAVGSIAALDMSKDAVFPTYRGHGWALACGVPTGSLFAELLGRQSGINGGRGGSAYNFAPSHGMYGENSIVGAGTVIAGGAALAAQFDESGRVSVAVIGDGAMNQGAVHEALNFASVRNLAMIFIVENNRYSELTPIADMAKIDRLYRRASPYGIRGVRIDGNDVDVVEKTVREAAANARTGQGPVLIEATTERLVGHYIGDAQTYRRPGELEEIAISEPIGRYASALAARGYSLSQIDSLRTRVEAEIAESAAWALNEPKSDPSSVLEHLYA